MDDLRFALEQEATLWSAPTFSARRTLQSKLNSLRMATSRD